jgi:PIN domain nuclease of toxin-antitoxin system
MPKRSSTSPGTTATRFDRLLVAQAMAERLELVSADARLGAYGVDLLW